MKKGLLMGLIMVLVLAVPSFAHDFTSELDDQIQYETVNYNVPGLMVGIVQDGEVIYDYHNGYSNAQTKMLVNPDETVIQTGSVAKLITTMRLIQLLDEHNISLETPIRQYLDPEVVPDETLTIQQVLTHSTGIATLKSNTARLESPLSEDPIGFSTYASAYMTQYKHKPKLNPGEFPNYATANSVLAGLLVEAISQDTYEDDIVSFLEAYDMDVSAAYLKGESLSGPIAKGYSVYGGAFTAQPLYKTQLISSEDFVTTGSDLEKLLIGLTRQNILYSGLTTSQISAHGDILGRSLGFSVNLIDSHELYVQDGAIPGETTRIIYDPVSNIGVYIWYNSANTSVRDVLSTQIVETVLGKGSFTPPQALPYDKSERQEYQYLIGAYSPVNISNESVEKVTRIINQIRVSETDEGLMIDKKPYVYVGDAQFYNSDNQDFATFKFNDKGQLTYLVIDNTVYQKTKFYESLLIEIPQLGLVAFFNALALLIIIFRWKHLLVNRIHRTPRTVLLIGTLIGVAIAGLVLVIALEYNAWNIIYGIDHTTVWIKALGIISFIWLIPSFIMINRGKADFRWSGASVFVFRLQLLLNLLMVVWLWTYHFI